MASGGKKAPFGGVRLPSAADKRSSRSKAISESDSDTSERGYDYHSEDSEDDGGLPRVSTLRLAERRGETRPRREPPRVESRRWDEGRGETPARGGQPRVESRRETPSMRGEPRVESRGWDEGRGTTPARGGQPRVESRWETPSMRGEPRVASRRWDEGPREGRRETPVRRQPIMIVVVTTPNQLSPLGTIQPIAATEESHKVISNYAKNSSGPGWELTVTNVYEIISGVPTPTLPNNNNNPLNVLLWCKTTPTTVKYLAQQENSSWVALYDRIERAFPVTADESGRDPLSQIIVLCSVALGKPLKADKGYHHWRNAQLPSGFDSVIARGKLQPDWEESREMNSVLIPCGKTKEQKGNGRDANNLRYSEYLVNSATRITPLYAVEITTAPKTVQYDQL